jgi:hypothetical protein
MHFDVRPNPFFKPTVSDWGGVVNWQTGRFPARHGAGPVEAFGAKFFSETGPSFSGYALNRRDVEIGKSTVTWRNLGHGA